MAQAESQPTSAAAAASEAPVPPSPKAVVPASAILLHPGNLQLLEDMVLVALDLLGAWCDEQRAQLTGRVPPEHQFDASQPYDARSVIHNHLEFVTRVLYEPPSCVVGGLVILMRAVLAKRVFVNRANQGLLFILSTQCAMDMYDDHAFLHTDVNRHLQIRDYGRLCTYFLSVIKCDLYHTPEQFESVCEQLLDRAPIEHREAIVRMRNSVH